ncbi:MAG: hypothetical protein COA58_14590 [Bacteroidetes bacterium]|nr:MAG: hypothetical protein COA58_14590 [Bacteroidota bacterium]
MFQATYSHDFKQIDFVKNIIHDWKNGIRTFTLKTSGSTGTPKKVALKKELLIWSVKSTKKVLNLAFTTNEERVLCCLPIEKTGGFMQLIRALHFGWSIHFVNPSSNPLAAIPESRLFSQVSFTPQQIEHILETHKGELSKFNTVLIGGAVISVELENKIIHQDKATETHFWETYGMTETASHIALRKIGVDSLFQPQPGVKLSLTNSLLRIDIPEINISVMTNDLAKIEVHGFEIVGRADDIINSGGLKLNPVELEPQIQLVLDSQNIHRNFYLGKAPDQKLGERAVLVIEGKPFGGISEIINLLKKDLPRHSSPTEITFIPFLTYTDTGKVVRRPI